MRKSFLVLITIMALVMVSLGAAVVTVDQGVGASVTVNEFVSITLTDAGATGVIFGSSDPGVDNNPDAAQDTAQVTPAISVKNDAISNVNVNVDVKGTVFTGDPSGSMVVGQATYDDDGTADQDGSETGEVETTLTTTYPGSSYYPAVAPDSSVGFWFFLDIPSGQTAATYSSTFTFQGSS